MKSFDIFNPKTKIQGKFFLEASAGTGKTFTIEQIILRSLLENSAEHVDNILAVTFTNAATNEMKVRIQENIERTVSQLKNTPATLPPYLEKETNVKLLYIKLRNSLASLDRMSIFTIHGFCNFILKQYFPEIYFASTSQSLTHNQMVLHHIREYMKQDLWKRVLSQEQFKRLATQYNVSSSRSKFLIDEIFKNYTRQNKANFVNVYPEFQEQLRLFREDLKNIDQESCLADLESYNSGTESRYRLSSKSIRRIVDILYSNTYEDFILVAQALDKWKHRLKKQIPTPIAEALVKSKLSALIIQAHDPTLIFNILLQDIQKYLREHFTPWLSPDASIDILETLLSSSKAKSLIEKVRKKFQLVLIDEFQDTDKKQWSIFSKLFASEEYQGSLFLIGDPKQSIYEWRNADLKTYLKAKSSFSQDAQLCLVNNYRSTSELMDSINKLFSALNPFLKIEDDHKEYESIYYHPLEARSSNTHAYDEYRPIHFVSFSSDVDLANWISATSLDIKKTYNIPLGRMAILVCDSKQALNLMTLSSVPVAFSKKRSVFERTETFYLTLDWLEALIYPEKENKTQKVLISNLFGYSPNEIIERKEEFSSFFFSMHSHLLSYGLLSTFYTFMSHQGATLFKTPQGDLIFQEMEIFCSYLDKVSKNPYEQLLHLQHISETGNDEEALSFSCHSDDDNTLKITTIHSSKGLEYDVIFACGLDKSSTHQLGQEAIREMYVACTRARKILFIPIKSAKRNKSILSYYVEHQSLTKDDSTYIFANRLTELFPDNFSLSHIENVPIPDTQKKFNLCKPNFYNIPSPPPDMKIFSFSSSNTQVEEESYLEVTQPQQQSRVLPQGKSTGIIIHKILEHIIPNFLIKEEELFSCVTTFVKDTHLNGYEQTITNMLLTAFSAPLNFSQDIFSLIDVDPSKVLSEEAFLFLKEDGLYQGAIDLFFEHNRKYYILDWKTSFLGDTPSDYNPKNILDYIEKRNLEEQGRIYLQATTRFLQQFDIHTNVEVGFVFLRGCDKLGNGFAKLNYN
ncbi:uvrD/REP helicase N-terminal domain protein [Chlamydia ibidis]|uniref:RecBCD enzyme subunit RecB n=2 Tax=Chlamydia ibidis TaxID=1405396 RepID=S7J2I4_9CHLA|nr:UvrD-helicase domain-containing protein [Chlamydia ibidis]EPP34634.1 uvrD/REP helicase N-terminal domain protein [Chlamydia ibidis]EQM63239.1 uvrD/REP helicase family protein [Chlamydia ibidis 10-1398/6]